MALAMTRLRAARLFVPAALLLVAATPSSARWGETGHRIIGDAAARALPSEMPAFFRNAAPDLVYLSYEPDRWRDQGEASLDPALGSGGGWDHFVDFEGVPDDAFKAKDRYDFLAALRAVNKDHAVGFLPFRITELTQRIRLGFRQWRAETSESGKRRLEARIINDAGILGHYVGDGANPHHTTIHHNGWVGDNPNGYATDRRTHYRFEGAYVQSHLAVDDVAPLVTAPATSVANVRAATMAFLRQTYTQLQPLYELDKAERFDSATVATTHKQFVSARLAAGATMLRDLWWSAWIASGQPLPPRAPRE